jgi:Holliday junction DNA helicase RuvA
MISCLRGILLECSTDSIIVDVHGLGLEIFLNQSALKTLPLPGESIFLYTYLQVSENDLRLYGFLQKEQLHLFKKLLGVSGMGAKGAMNVLSFMNPEQFHEAVASSDVKLLTKIPGIGKKSAERLIFELKGKLGDINIAASKTDGQGKLLEEVYDALEALGYGRSEVYSSITELTSKGEMGNSVEETIKRVLKLQAQKVR